MEITQERVNLFADATGDHQWIHIDVERAKKESPFGGPIAHGYLTLSLAPVLLPQVCISTGFKMGVNYGCNKVRFMSPVPVGRQPPPRREAARGRRHRRWRAEHVRAHLRDRGRRQAELRRRGASSAATSDVTRSRPEVATLHVGCPMWAQRAWVGRYLPADTSSGQELYPYSRLLNAVEGNTTFYALPPEATIRKWAELAEPDFRFVFKVPRSITHDQRLRDVDVELAAFVKLMLPLGNLIGGLTLQLPPSFGPRDLDALDHVLLKAPQVWRWSVEVRHADFFGGDGRRALDRVLMRHRAERVRPRHRVTLPPHADQRGRARRMAHEATRPAARRCRSPTGRSCASSAATTPS